MTFLAPLNARVVSPLLWLLVLATPLTAFIQIAVHEEWQSLAVQKFTHANHNLVDVATAPVGISYCYHEFALPQWLLL